NSMRPKYQNGSNAVTDTDYPFEDLRVGDDVTFIHDNGDGSESYFTHRIEGVLYDITGAPIYKTKGTNNRNPDRGLMSKNDYIGKTISEKEFYAGVK
ncbi:hypothetical protein EB061_09460, partial [bacterium]|nr:hypothetical protein [bacterium]